MTNPTFHLIPHVHWDREWYLSRTAFAARFIPMMDRLLELLGADRRLRFHLDGQTILIEDYLAVVPDARSAIETLVRNGQLGIGPWYVLADELIPSGESLRRNLRVGMEMARRLGGEVPVLYCPDQFGHPAGLPDLANGAGIRSGVVWRGLGAVGGKERDLYRWVGPAGGEIVVHHLPPEGYEIGSGLVTAGRRLRDDWRQLRTQLLRRAASSEIAIPVGADHHAADPSLGLLAATIQGLESRGTVRFSSWREYFDAVAAAEPVLTTITGEQRDSSGYVWSLQGTHATRARMKRRFAIAEHTLERVVDPLVRLATVAEPVLERTWRSLLECQLHDTLCGCSSDAVTAEQDVRLEGIEAAAGELARRASFRLIGHDPDLAREDPNAIGSVLVAYNGGDRSRPGVLLTETTWFSADELVGPPGDRSPREGMGYRAFHFESSDGRPLPVQVLRVSPGLERRDAPRHYPDLDHVDRVWAAVWLDDLAPGVNVLRIAEGTVPIRTRLDHVERVGLGLDNGRVMVTLDADGLVTLVDHASGARYERLFEVESEPDHGDLYTPDIIAERVSRSRSRGVRPVADGPLVGAIERDWSLTPTGGGAVHGRTAISLHAAEAAIRVRIELDNWAIDHRLRLRLPVGLSEVIAGAPLGSERRGPGRLDRRWPEEATLPTAPAHRWLAASENRPPFRIELPGFFEYQLEENGDLLVTLLRSVGRLSRADGSCRRGNAGWCMETPAAQEPGRHVIDLIVGTTGWVSSDVWALGIRGVRR